LSDKAREEYLQMLEEKFSSGMLSREWMAQQLAQL
jgi:hypothetical protein